LQGELSIPIFTGGRIRGQIDQAQGVLREAESSLDQLRSQIETEVLTAIAGVEWAQKEVATSAANVTLSRQEVELSRQRFARGITDNTEVVNAQDRVSRADDARVRAMYTLGLARANLSRDRGRGEDLPQMRMRGSYESNLVSIRDCIIARDDRMYETLQAERHTVCERTD
jgi:outer membrane protein TolC